MSFSPFNLYTQFRPDIEHFTPFSERRYTLTHSDQTGDLFLTVSKEYAYDQVNQMRDEVFGEWLTNVDQVPFFQGQVFVGDEAISEETQHVRFAIFKRELKTALQGIFYGERWLLEMNPPLLTAPVYIRFISNLPSYQGHLFYGHVKDYV